MIVALRDVFVAPLAGQTGRCRIVHGIDQRCTNAGVRFDNLNIGGEPMVVCHYCAEVIKPSAFPKARMKMVPSGWIDLSGIERQHPWLNDPERQAAEELRRRAKE